MTRMAYPQPDAHIAERRKQRGPAPTTRFRNSAGRCSPTARLTRTPSSSSRWPFAHVTQCPCCIRDHATAALRKGADERELMEAIWVAAELRAGGAYAHSTLALDAAGRANGPRAA